MLNIMVPMAGKSPFFSSQDYPFPKPLIEINGIPMIQYVISYLSAINAEKRFIFVVNREDCKRNHLDNTMRLLTNENCIIIQQEGDTGGGACSSLLAIEHINNEDPLIISNSDQFIQEDMNLVMDFFDKKKADAGVICFDSVHPKWSYVRLDENEKIIETAEKNPISRNAIAGFYYFRQGKDFVKAAMNSILKDSNVNGLYYIAPTYNELVLAGKNLYPYKISTEKYHSFYSAQKIKEFEKLKNKSV